MKTKAIRNIVVIIVLIPFLSSCGYNTMVTMDEAVQAQWSNIENSYQRRSDLIPNLVSTVKGYAAHEKETLEGVINARAKATSVNIDAKNLDAAAIQKFQGAQSGLTSALSKLMVVIEKYPELKANQNFRDLQNQLEGTENRIATERRKFNETVEKYNSYTRSFPQNIVAMIFGFEPKDYFKADEKAMEAPKVEF